MKTFFTVCIIFTSAWASAADRIAPTVSVTAPLASAVISGSSVIFAAKASDNVGVTKVFFYVDKGVLLGSDRRAPYKIQFDSTQLSDGVHGFYAIARDRAGNYTASAIVSVTVSNQTPAPTPDPTPAPSPEPTPAPTPSPVPETSLPHAAEALKMADFILKNQDAGGAIKDSPGESICNEDSNMEYALLGLAAAYVYSKDSKYLVGFEKGIAWLADREDMSSTQWRGSWFYTYQCSSPYAHVATSPGGGVTDVRGVDTTSAYFAYLLYIDSRISGSNSLALKYADNARAALDFVMRMNLDSNGLSNSSYQLINGVWKLWPYQYTADQADVYLGFRAGGLLFADPTYAGVADNLQSKIPALFYDTRAARYAEGLDGGALDWSNEFDAVFPQGYVPWVLGASPESSGAYHWLASKVQADGSLMCWGTDPKFTLSASEFVMSSNALRQASPSTTIDWILGVAYDPQTGGLKDSTKDNTLYTNVAAFTILGLLNQSSLGW